MVLCLISVLADDDLLNYWSVLPCFPCCGWRSSLWHWRMKQQSGCWVRMRQRAWSPGPGKPGEEQKSLQWFWLSLTQQGMKSLLRRGLEKDEVAGISLVPGWGPPRRSSGQGGGRIPYQLPAVPREAKDCLVCQQKFKTHHKLMKHMGVHRGEKFPVRSVVRYWPVGGCSGDTWVPVCRGGRSACPDCGKEYASTQGISQHHKANHGVDAPELDKGFYCPHCNKLFRVKKSMKEHATMCADNSNRKGPFFCRVPGCPSADHIFNRIKNLNNISPVCTAG